MTPRRKRRLLLTVLAVMALGWIVWSALAYLQYCVAPPLGLSIVFFAIFLGLVFYTIHVGKRAPARR